MNYTQDGDGLMVLGFIAKGVGNDVGHPAHHSFIGAGHTPFTTRGRGGKSLNGLIDTGGYVVGGGRIVLRNIADDAAKSLWACFDQTTRLTSSAALFLLF